jgi:chromosome segregation ATPase
MAKHALENLSLYERLIKLEQDMSAVHEAVNQLAQRINELEILMQQRDDSHVEAVNEQIARTDGLITRLRDESAGSREHQAPESSADPAQPEGLLGGTAQESAHY